MDRYVTGAVIRRLRESRKLTREELAEQIYVNGKAVSKWETGKGCPNISLLEPLAGALGVSMLKPLAGALGVSVLELLSGDCVLNTNRSGNMGRSSIYLH